MMVLQTSAGFALLLSVVSASAGDAGSYDVALIPAGLRKEAAVVIREHHMRLEVFDRASAEVTRTMAYTVFRPDGRKFGLCRIPYDRFVSVEELDGTLYDQSGREIRTLRSDDVKDESNIAAYSLYEDSRVRTAELYHDQYPYTVEFRCRIKYKGILSFPGWAAQPSDEPVVHTSFEVVVPEQEQLRYWASADSLRPGVTIAKGRRHYLWSASNLAELSEEDMEEDIERRTAVVRIAPREFELDDRPGTMADWKSFGVWAAALFHGKGTLVPKACGEVAAILQGAATEREKAARLYCFMQKRTHYMNVTLGIGGWEPYDAMYVYQRGYGDCKALSNFMVALLAEAGIKGHPALIDAGGDRSVTLENFPSPEFNHVIVCVPYGRDTIWLECTSQDFPFGYLGSFTENRPVLLLTPGGGVLVRTPASNHRDNLLSRKGRVELRGLGDATASMVVRRAGNRSETVRSTMLHGSPEEKERWAAAEMGVSGAKVRTFGVTGVGDQSLQIEETLLVDLPRFASVSGTRIFFQPNLTNRNATAPKERKTRKTPVRFSFPRSDIDTLLYILPRGSVCEALPAPVTMDASFGTFRSSAVALGDSAILYTRRFDVLQNEIPPDKFQEYARFMREVARADRAQAVVRAP